MKKGVKEWLDAGVEALVIIAILFFLFWPVKIEGISMENTFFENDRVVVSRVMSMLNMYDKGDIIVFNAEKNGEKLKIIKRVIALSGDSVEIKEGKVYVNGNEIEEEYIKGETFGDVNMIVPEDSVYVLGDNREKSTDSRVMGTIKKGRISGKVILRIYPIKGIKIY